MVSTDLVAHRRVLIVGQKIAVAASLAYVVYLTLVIRRRSAGDRVLVVGRWRRRAPADAYAV